MMLLQRKHHGFYKDTDDKVLIMNVEDKDKELIKRAAGLLSLASVEPKGDTFSQCW